MLRLAACFLVGFAVTEGVYILYHFLIRNYEAALLSFTGFTISSLLLLFVFYLDRRHSRANEEKNFDV